MTRKVPIPSASAWQQYSCTTTGCKGLKRVGIAPTHAPMTLPTGCELCGKITRHRASGGSGCIRLPEEDDE